jgi:hypothetical protein
MRCWNGAPFAVMAIEHEGDMSQAVLRTLSLIALVAAVIPTPAAADTRLEGVYVSRAVNPDGSVSRGTVHIAQQGESFFVSWMSVHIVENVALLELTSVGVGIVSGATLSVSYLDAEDRLGIVVYQIENDGRELRGRGTTIEDDGAIYSETLSRLTAAQPEPGVAEPPDDSVTFSGSGSARSRTGGQHVDRQAVVTGRTLRRHERP